MNRVTMRRGMLAVVAVATVVLAVPALAGAATIVVDDFQTPQSSLGGSMVFPPATGTTSKVVTAATGAGILGGERDIYEFNVRINPDDFVAYHEGDGAWMYVDGQFTASRQFGVAADGLLAWDGVDGGAAAVNATGLGGIDLTDGGANTRFELQFGTNLGATGFALNVYTDATHYSTLPLSLPFGFGTAYPDFTSFTTGGGASGPADFTNVGAITITFNGSRSGSGPIVDYLAAEPPSDTTLPTITASAATADGATYVSGTWTKQNVTVTFACTDDGSGVATVTSPITRTASAANQSATGTCTDNAGNTASATFNGIDIDKVAPAISTSRAPAANEFGWNNGSVTVAWTCSDALSGVQSTPSPVTFSGEGANQSALGTCADHAGNSAVLTSALVSIDLTAPTNVFTSATPAANPAGWNRTPVTVTFTCTDALSGPIAGGSVIGLNGETANGGTTSTCTDHAGNSVTVASPTIKIDLTAPTLTLSSTYVAGTWTNGDVTITAACGDGLSGVATAPPASSTLSDESNGLQYTETCTDVAGNVASQTFGPVNIDKTAPTIAAHTGGYTPGTWTADPVTVSFTCTDDASDVASVSGPTTFSTDTKNGSVTGTCTDVAGNTASATVENIDVDNSPPTLTLSSAYTPGTWTNQDVTVTATCTDDGSGVDSVPAPETISTEGANQQYTATCTDVLGHTAIATFGPVNIDKTAPTLTASTGAYVPGAWTADDVTATFTCDDGLSGAASVTSPYTFSGDVRDGSVTGHCTDYAGNEASATVEHVDIDGTPPTISGTPSTTGWTNAPVTVTFTCDDAGSGVASCTSPVTVSTEGADQSVTGTATDKVGHSASTTVDGIDIDLTAPLVSFSGNAGTYGVDDTIAITCSAADLLSGLAQSSCPGASGPAWQYLGANTLDASATDVAGNAASATATFTVTVEAADLCTLVQHVVSNAGIANSLCAKVTAPGKTQAKAFANEVKAQRGKAIPPDTADLLIRLAGLL